MSIFLLNSYVYEVVDIPVERIANAKAMSFNGTDQYISTNDIFSALDGLQKMTLSVWIKPTNLNFRHIITIASGTGNSNNLIRLATRNTGALWWNVQTSGSNAIETTPALILNQWNHIGLIFDSTQSAVSDYVKMFVNGTLSPATVSMNAGKTIGTATGGIFIGENAGSLSYLYSFAGEMDEVALFNTALSDSKIQQIYDATAVVGGVPQTANLFTGGLSSSLVYWNRMGDS